MICTMLFEVKLRYIQLQVQEAAGGRILSVKTRRKTAGQLSLRRFAMWCRVDYLGTRGRNFPLIFRHPKVSQI